MRGASRKGIFFIGLAGVLGGLMAIAAESARAQLAFESVAFERLEGRETDDYGRAVALDGDWAVVSMHNDHNPVPSSGTVAVYSRTGGDWVEDTILRPPEPVFSEHFGFALALDGDTAAICAPHDDPVPGAEIQDSGAAYIFRRGADGWSLEAQIVPADPTDGGTFCISIDLEDDVLAIGDGTDKGAVYVFRRSGATWSQEAKLRPQGVQVRDEYAYAVALSGEWLAVAARHRYDELGDPGEVHMFRHQGGSNWKREQILVGSEALTPESSFGGENFGHALALEGDTLVVGTDFSGSLPTGAGYAGVAYVFEHDGSSWSETQILTPSNPENFDGFGSALALEGDRVLVGAPDADRDGISYRGAVYVFERAGAAFTEQVELTPQGPPGDRKFGRSLAISGGVALAGSSISSTTTRLSRAVYVLRESAGTWSSEQRLTADFSAAADRAASALHLTPGQLLIGVPHDDDAKRAVGSVYSYDSMLENGNYLRLGRTVAPDGEPGDAFGDAVSSQRWSSKIFMAVGAPGHDHAGPDAGAVYTFRRSQGFQFGFLAEYLAPDAAPGDAFGSALVFSEGELLVGAPGHDGAAGDAGALYRFQRMSDALSLREILLPETPVGGDGFGSSIAREGATIAVGAPGAETAWIYRDGPLLALESQLVPAGGGAGEAYGSAIAAGGGAIAVGAPDADGGAGAAYLFEPGPSGWEQRARLTASDGSAGDGFGASVSLRGSVLLVGAPGAAGAGAAYLFTREAGGVWIEQGRLALSDGLPGDEFGAVVVAGDSLYLIGAPSRNVPDTDAGAAYLFTALDLDEDGLEYSEDNCPTQFNPDQADSDGDKTGDACDDSDDDGVVDAVDTCVGTPDPDQQDRDGDGMGDLCDPDEDADGDGIDNLIDNCLWVANRGQEDADTDGVGDLCDADVESDGDWVYNDLDNCPLVSNRDQADSDADGEGDACDPDFDFDNDGVLNGVDNCPLVENPGQADSDGDGEGDACEPAACENGLDDDGDGLIDYGADPGCTSAGFDDEDPEEIVRKLRAQDALRADRFAEHLAADGDLLAVSAPEDGDGGRSSGSVAIYRRVAGSWTLEAEFDLADEPDPAVREEFATGPFPDHPLALSGDTLAVGGNDVVYVLRHGPGGWQQEAILTAGTPYRSYLFGSSVAVDGDRIVVGARADNHGSSPWYYVNGYGAAYVFERSGTTWTRTAVLTSPSPREDGNYGLAVDVDGDTIAVSETGTSWGVDPWDPGRVYLYRGAGSGLTLEATLHSEEQQLRDRFGQAISLDGDRIAIACAQGTHVFERGAGDWSELQVLSPWLPEKVDVALEGDRLVVGDPKRSSFGLWSGAVLSFANLNGRWVSTGRLIASDAVQDDHFGSSLNLSGGTLFAGAVHQDFSWTTDDDPSVVYVYEPQGSEWNEVAILGADLRASDDGFGHAVAIDAEVLVVGSPRDDTSHPETGSAFAFELKNGQHWRETFRFVAPDRETGDEFGAAVALSDDVAVIGAPGDSELGECSGSAHVFRRTPPSNPNAWSWGRWVPEGVLRAPDGAALDRFGEAVSIHGNTIVVGAGGADLQGEDSGAAYVFGFGPTGWTFEERLLHPEGPSFARFGASVAVSGSSVLVGSPGDDAAGPGGGSAQVFTRGAGWVHEGELRPSGATGREEFGASVSLMGDTALVGAPGDAAGGAAYMFERTPGQWGPGLRFESDAPAAGNEFGASVSLSVFASRIAVGEPGAEAQRGRVHRFVRADEGWERLASLEAFDGAPGQRFGGAVAGGLGGTVVGAEFDDEEAADAGAAYAFLSPDTDGDGLNDLSDNCPISYNPDQTDSNGDGVGDACETTIDSDGDGLLNVDDNCPFDPNPSQLDLDGDGRGDACDHSDTDGVVDALDNCPFASNASQEDLDGDGIGDACDDSDADGSFDSDDNCPFLANADQTDSDRDGVGDACDLVRAPACSDGIDNDGDGLVDYPSDPGCASPHVLGEDYTVYHVNSTDDELEATSGEGDQECLTESGVCTLRAALLEAMYSGEATVIALPQGIFRLTIPDPYSDEDEDEGLAGDLDLWAEDEPIFIVGEGRDLTKINARGKTRVLDAWQGDVFVEGLSLINGKTDWEGGCVRALGNLTLRDVAVRGCTAIDGGGGISTAWVSSEWGELTLIDSVVEAGNGGWLGGGIYAKNGTVTLTRTTVRNNTAEDGGGIANESSELVLIDSTVRNNEAYYDGGGILNEGTTRIVRSTIHDNVARNGDGGGIHNEESLEIHASTVTGNLADDNGGGIRNSYGSLALSSSTLTRNEAWRSGGIDNRGAATLDHNLIAGNFYDFAENPSDCDEWSGYPITSLGHNLIGAADDCPSIDHATDLKGTLAGPLDPGLEPLGFYGGPTETHALAPGSPAIDAGAAASCGPVDQRGQARSADGDGDTLPLCDIGAFELIPSACGDPARTIEAVPGCHALGGDPSACTQAFQISGMGEAESCFVASDGSCQACTADRQAVGLCANACNAICEDLARWNNAGESSDDGPCTLYYDDPLACEATFYVDTAGAPVSCFYDTEHGDCLGCTTELREEALCRNECLPAACVDPGRPLEVVECVDLGADDFLCGAAYEIGPSGEARTCFTGSDGFCIACEDLDQARGQCANTCLALPCADSSLTLNAGTEAYGGCSQLDGDPAACGSAFQTIYDGSFESCYDDNGACRGCDPDAEAEELCENTCGSSVCGNGRIFGDEMCDDGNASGSDGCSFICRVEPGWECSGEPSRCFPTTGQTREQQTCIKDTLSQGVSLAKMHNRVDLACLKDANRGRTDKLAGLGQTATVDACTQNDVRGRIARRISTLVDRQQRLCLAAPEQLPDMCYAGAATVLATSRTEPVGLMRDLLGDVLHDAVLPITQGRDDTICQEHLVRFTQFFFEQLWNEALRTIKLSLRDPAVSSPEEVEARVLQDLNEDPRGRIARATAQLVDRLRTRCTGIALANVAPGSCSGAADTNQLAACAEQHARCRFCRALTEAAAITLDCDAFDGQDPGGDGSCP